MGRNQVIEDIKDNLAKIQDEAMTLPDDDPIKAVVLEESIGFWRRIKENQ